MNTTANNPASDVDAPVRKRVTVKAGAAHAFKVFTDGIDSWWPRAHHIGKSPMKRAIIEPKPGGRCYTEQEDGTDCDWGSVLVWEPPRRFVMAWQISGAWEYEPDLAKSSEVEVRFTPMTGGMTRVDLEHRHFSRHGAAGSAMRAVIDSPNGWNSTLALYSDQAERAANGGADR